MSMRSRQAALEFERLTEPYHARLFRLACSFCRQPDPANDLTQEALVKAFLAFDTFDQTQPIFPWLARILLKIIDLSSNYIPVTSIQCIATEIISVLR